MTCYTTTMRSDHDQNRILIIGADSLIGRALYLQLIQNGYEVLATTRRKSQTGHNIFYLDFADPIENWTIPHNISTAFICAAVNSLETCRQKPNDTAQINTQAPITLTQHCVSRGIFTVFLSTNLVFDGTCPFVTDSHPLHPQTEHGRQKAMAEQAILKHKSNVSIVRLSKVFSPKMDLLQNWLTALSQQEPIFPFMDKVVSLITLTTCIDVLMRVAEKKASGILQVSANADYTYAQLAYHLAQLLDADPKLVRPVSAKNSKIFLEHLPQYSTMDGSTAEHKLNFKMPQGDVMRDEALRANIATFKTLTQAPHISV